jgi:inorganic pyrophosphatase
MGSDLYAFKILSSSNRILESDVLYELHTDSSQKNMRRELKNLTIDTTAEEKVIRFKRFKELLQENNILIDDILETFSPYATVNKSTIESIGREYENQAGKQLFNCMDFVYHQLFAELNNSKPLMITDIEADVVSIHPDAGFPEKKVNQKVLLNDRKCFALRLLADIHDEEYDVKKEKSHIFGWYENSQKDSFYDSPDDFAKIIWGYDVLDTLKIKPKSKSFMKKNSAQWWSPLFENYDESINLPYMLNKIRIVVPLGWFPEFKEESDVFYSTAFW